MILSNDTKIFLLWNEKNKLKFLIDQLAKFIENVPNDNVNYETLELEFLQNGYFGEFETKNIIEYLGITKLSTLKKELIQLKNKLENVNKKISTNKQLNYFLSKCY